jgi:hypothetical protein
MPRAVALQCDSLEDKEKRLFGMGADLEGDASASVAREDAASPNPGERRVRLLECGGSAIERA